MALQVTLYRLVPQVIVSHCCLSLQVSGLPLTFNPSANLASEPDSAATPSVADEEGPFPDPPPRSRPSPYLQARCPLCFGGEVPSSRLADESVSLYIMYCILSDSEFVMFSPDVIVCVDACFTQKHRHQVSDPPLTHPRSVFVSDDIAEQMEQYVNSRREGLPAMEVTDDDADGYEGPLRVPASVLDACHKGFTAADASRVKGSTSLFDVTALMALLCRHDRVLWVVNMHSAGEKQHYALVLIELLFQHLPLATRVGLLYDIGCQLHRACIKWDFLDRYMHRLTFAISVFHAYGHQWPCQVIYHPRKCSGFGYSDGEGCERFWYGISSLIPYLRVCGVSFFFPAKVGYYFS